MYTLTLRANWRDRKRCAPGGTTCRRRRTLIVWAWWAYVCIFVGTQHNKLRLIYTFKLQGLLVCSRAVIIWMQHTPTRYGEWETLGHFERTGHWYFSMPWPGVYQWTFEHSEYQQTTKSLTQLTFGNGQLPSLQHFHQAPRWRSNVSSRNPRESTRTRSRVDLMTKT